MYPLLGYHTGLSLPLKHSVLPLFTPSFHPQSLATANLFHSFAFGVDHTAHSLFSLASFSE